MKIKFILQAEFRNNNINLLEKTFISYINMKYKFNKKMLEKSELLKLGDGGDSFVKFGFIFKDVPYTKIEKIINDCLLYNQNHVYLETRDFMPIDGLSNLLVRVIVMNDEDQGLFTINDGVINDGLTYRIFSRVKRLSTPTANPDFTPVENKPKKTKGRRKKS